MNTNTQPDVIAGFQIKANTALKAHGTHFDIHYEISNHSRDSLRGAEGTWCYYVMVSEQMLDASAFAEFWIAPGEPRVRSSGWAEPSYAYYSARFADAEWHGGVTYYEKLGGLDGGVRYVKIGCDFAHLWDEGRSYDFAYVEVKAKATIDALRRMYAFNRRCSYTGKWLPEAEMIADERGRFLSPEGKVSKDKLDADYAARKESA